MNELTTESPYELHKDLKFLGEIDHGAFGNVIHVYETKKNLDLAIKVINKVGVGIQLIKEMKEEISILKKLNHDNIVKFYGYSETNNQLLIKMEYIKYGTLSHWMKNNQKITEEQASLILFKVLSAVEYLHSLHICHRDIKPENIMISKENDLASIKIIDFGLSAQQFNYLSNNEYCGTFIYMAPEQIEKKLYHFSVDIWSIGILMYMLLNNGKHPFYQKGDQKQDFIKKIKTGKLNFINKLSYMAKNLNYKLCEPNPSWRYSANLAIKHPWITRNPKDEIPLTFNEILNRNNSKKNATSFLLISIFLNYYKKKEVQKKLNSNIINDNYNVDIFIKKKKSKNKNIIFIINKEYINRCNMISKKKQKKIERIREKCLEVLSTDEEDSFEKNQKETINNSNKNLSLKKIIKSSEKYISPQKKKIYAHESNLEYFKNMQLQKNLLKKYNNKNITLNGKENIEPIIHKLTFKEKSKLYLSNVQSNKSNNIFQRQKSDEMQINNNIHTYLNSKNRNQTNRGRAKSKSISKFYLNKQEEENDNENSLQNKLEFTPKKNKYKHNLPYVIAGNNINNRVNITNKKYHNNFIGNYNIVPLVLPFIGAKQEEKRNKMI